MIRVRRQVRTINKRPEKRASFFGSFLRSNDEKPYCRYNSRVWDKSFSA
jgi:hypothetical protein